MKRFLIILTLLLCGYCASYAQDTTRRAPVDSTLIGRDIISVLGPGVSLSQSDAIRQGLQKYIKANAEKKIVGYRIRVFYDNAPSARARSESIVRTLRGQYPSLGVYLSFESPNYKVALGDFRTKDEALPVYNALKNTYPTAYIIKESINYPR